MLVYVRMYVHKIIARVYDPRGVVYNLLVEVYEEMVLCIVLAVYSGTSE